MRRLFTCFVVAAITTVIPSLVLAGNQEVAEQIANKLRDSGQMSDYRIGVKFQDGTVWLRGQVSSEEQMNTALKLVFQLRGVDGVVNELKVASSAQYAEEESANAKSQDGGEGVTPASHAVPTEDNPLRDAEEPAPPIKHVKQNLMKRMGLVSKKPQQETVKVLSVRDEPVEYAEHSSDSDSSESIRQTSAQEPQEIPQSMAAPQHAKPIGKPLPGMARMAMMQPNVRGPVAPTGAPLPMYSAAANPAGVAPARYDQPCLPNYAWPSYAAYPNYAAVTYPKQYSPTAWPYIGPFYPYPQVPLGWRKVTLEWDSGWWFLDFKDQPASCWRR